MNDQAIEFNTNQFIQCNEFNDNDDAMHVSPTENSYHSMIDDKAQQMKPCCHQRETKFAMTQLTLDPDDAVELHIITQQQPHSENPYQHTPNSWQTNQDNDRDDASIDSIHKFDSIFPPRHMIVEDNVSTTSQNMTAFDHNHANIYYAHLQGQLVLIYIYHHGSMKPPASSCRGSMPTIIIFTLFALKLKILKLPSQKRLVPMKLRPTIHSTIQTNLNCWDFS